MNQVQKRQIECDIEPVTIPDSILAEIYEDLGKEEVSDEELEEYIWELQSEYNGKIVPQEIAEFLISYHLNEISPQGGYPKYVELPFELEDRSFTVACYFWARDVCEKYADPYIIGWENFKEESE